VNTISAWDEILQTAPCFFCGSGRLRGCGGTNLLAATVTNALHGLGLQAQEQGNSALAEPPLLSYALQSANNPLSSLIISLRLAWNRRMLQSCSQNGSKTLRLTMEARYRPIKLYYCVQARQVHNTPHGGQLLPWMSESVCYYRSSMADDR